MRVFARLLILVLMTAMLALNVPLPAAVDPACEDLGNVSDGVETFTVGEGGEGLAYTSHVVTATDVLGLVDDCSVYDPTVDYNVMFDGFGTGLAPPTLEDYADIVGNANIVTDVAIAPGGELPDAVDHSAEPYFPIADSQGGQGSCAAWATSYYTNGYLQAKDNGFTEAHNGTNKSHLMSPAWVYNKINYGRDSGSNWYRNHALMSSVGNADWENMPYNWRDLYGWGDEDAWRNAPSYRLRSTYDLAYTSSTMVIKAWLAEGYVLPMAFDAGQYSKLSDDDIISAVEYSSLSANHANTIVGYNDSIEADGEAGAFLIVNSWGLTWSGNGYWWMTYDALAELYWPILRMYDYVDYEPTMLATLNQSTLGSKDSKIHFGTTSGSYTNRQPLWWAGTREYPEFMCLDISELVEDISLADYFLYFASGATTATVSSFEVEWYPSGYEEGTPSMKANSSDTPKTVPGTMYASFSGFHIDHTLPAANTTHRDVVTINGTATGSIPRVIIEEDFEGRWMYGWDLEDADSRAGEDHWGISTVRTNGGDRSAWCAASDAGMVLYEGFENGSAPTGWSTASLGPDAHPFTFVNTGYQGCGGVDYLAACDSDRGAGTNMTERFYTSTPANASNFENLTLRFYVSYDHYGGDEHVKVLYANASTYPNYTALDTYTADTFGYQTYDLSSQDGEAEVYLAFEYHGTADRFVTLDDIMLAGDKSWYDPYMKADLYIDVPDLSTYDTVNLTYNHWLDSENGTDFLHAMYRTSSTGAWMMLANHSGPDRSWTESWVEVPTNASHVGFRFSSDITNSSEGAYLDNVTLTGHQAISSIEVSTDGGQWETGVAGAEWHYLWNTTGLSDGTHHLVARVNYSGAFDMVAFDLLTDNTPPQVHDQWNDTVSTGDATVLHVKAEDPNGVATVQVLYNFNALPEEVANVTVEQDGTWHFDLQAPSDGVDLSYRFMLNDTIGNVIETEKQQVHVIDNDLPVMGPDLSSEEATTGDDFNFSLSAEDNVEVKKVTLEYWYNGETATMVSKDTDSFRHVIEVRDTLDTLHYRFIVEDTSGNTLEGETRSVRVGDNDVPVFSEDTTPAEATTGENVTFRIGISDNIGLNATWIEYWFGGGPHGEAPLVNESDGNWSFIVDVPLDSLSPIHYIFHAEDTSGNVNSTARMKVDVLDNDLPWFGEDGTVLEATTGDEHVFEVNLDDNIAVVSAQVEYWYDDRGHIWVDMVRAEGDLWTVTIVTIHTVEPMHYLFHIEDSSGNANSSYVKEVVMWDNDEPIVMEDASPGSTTTGVDYGFAITVIDNMHVDGVNITYWFDGGEPVVSLMSGDDLDGNGNGTYTLLISIPSYSTDPLYYLVEVWDDVGNSNTTEERMVPVLDVTHPVAKAGDDHVVDQHEDVTFSSEGSSDNVGIVSFTWVIKRGGSIVELEGPSPVHTFHAAGTYSVTLTVADPSGNEDTDTAEVVVNDITPPIPDAGKDRVKDQNTSAIFDGSGSRDNVAIETWTWTFEYGQVDKEFKGAEMLFTFYIPGVYPVTLTVVDRAGNSNSTTVRVTVRDIIFPEARTQGDLEGRLDEAVTFSAFHSRDNVGIVNWTWVIVMDRTTGEIVVYGEEVEYVFDQPGDHSVTLTVKDADGNTGSSESFTVHVPNTPLWTALILILLAGVGATIILVYYTRWKTHKLDEEMMGR